MTNFTRKSFSVGMSDAAKDREDFAKRWEATFKGGRMKEHKEPTVTLNGVLLSPNQTAALRSAVAGMLIEMQDPDALGKDKHGRFMVKAYRKELAEVQDLIFGSSNCEEEP